MKIKYECDYCQAQFDTETACRVHEILHLNGIEAVKYYIQYATIEDVCSYCDNAYYVYGVDFNCPYPDCNVKNNYKNFKGDKINDFKKYICTSHDET